MKDDKKAIDDDQFNLNWAWINHLNNLMVDYYVLKREKNYEGMYDCLVTMEDTLAPKIEKDEVEKNLDLIKRNLMQMVVRGEDGQVVKYYPQLIDITINLLGETYRMIMIKMDAAGLLTKQPKDPNKAFGNFSGS